MSLSVPQHVPRGLSATFVGAFDGGAYYTDPSRFPLAMGTRTLGEWQRDQWWQSGFPVEVIYYVAGLGYVYKNLSQIVIAFDSDRMDGDYHTVLVDVIHSEDLDAFIALKLMEKAHG